MAQARNWVRCFMRKMFRVPAVVASAVVTASLLIPASAPAQGATSKKLLWAEEFNAKKVSSVSTKNWKYDLGDGYGWGNSEQEYYTKNRENIKINGKGQLEITAKRIPETSTILDRCLSCQFTSAKIKTADKLGFKYGRMEARIKLPAGKGTWPAFWMLGAGLTKGEVWPDCGEIDIVEAKGSQPYTAWGTLHGPGYSGQNGTQRGSVFMNMGSALSNEYHVYAIDWKPNQIDFYVDNNLYFTHTATDVAPNKWAFNGEFFLILNLATGGNFEPDIDPMLQTATMSVDYIRYYQVGKYGKLYKH